jgi:transcriptional regulator with XRE-family HTH domain
MAGGVAVNANPEIAARIEGRLERLGLSADEVDRLAGLPAGTVLALTHGNAALPRWSALRRLAVALDVEEEVVLGLEPGDLIPADMLEEPQGDLGLLAPDEEALLRNYRRLDVATRAAVALLLSRAAGPELEPIEPKVKPARRSGRASQLKAPANQIVGSGAVQALGHFRRSAWVQAACLRAAAERSVLLRCGGLRRSPDR